MCSFASRSWVCAAFIATSSAVPANALAVQEPNGNTPPAAPAIQPSAPPGASAGDPQAPTTEAKASGTSTTDTQSSDADSTTQSQRRGLPPPYNSPPYPSGEYQGYPLIGIPPSETHWPLQEWLDDTALGRGMSHNRILIYGWLNGSGNLSSSENSNMPSSYWIVPDSFQLDQAIVRVERPVDSAQKDHVDWGFRSTFLYGMDYRYMTSGGWFSDQLLVHNNLYGFDPTEQYVDVFFPDVEEGLDLRVGRWIACPDIETQFAPDNYMGSHSLLFTVDTYTQTGVMATVMHDDQWTWQAGLHAGTDMAPWYEGAVLTGMAGVRWVSQDNNDSIYTVLNAINNAEFQRFDVHGQAAGHDNFNYLVSTWQHTFSPEIHTKTEGYFMWQKDAVVGGTPSIGPVHDFGGGGGIGADIAGTTLTYGLLNYTMFQQTEKDFLTVRNEVVRDEDGERYGYAGTYSSHSLGWTHNFNTLVQFRPEVGYYRNWDRDAFDLGTSQDMWLLAFDLTVRF
jgi:hypothetical protein